MSRRKYMSRGKISKNSKLHKERIFYMEIYERIDALIEDNETQVNELAEIAGVTRRTITRWRTGEVPEMGIHKLKAICQHYGVSADYILGLPKGLEWPR